MKQAESFFVHSINLSALMKRPGLSTKGPKYKALVVELLVWRPLSLSPFWKFALTVSHGITFSDIVRMADPLSKGTEV